MAKRTDIHRPGAIIPAHYRYFCSYALGTVVDNWPVPPWNIDIVMKLQKEQTFVKTGGIGNCSICGAHFIYGDVWVHEPTGHHLHVGHDCAAKYEMLADRSEFELEHGRLKAAAARECHRAMRAKERKAFLEAHSGLEKALETDHRIVQDIKARFLEFCVLSDKQIALVQKIALEASKPPEEQEKTVTAPASSDKRVTFSGVVVSAKTMDSAYGESYKMTVKVTTPEGVWLAWGTVPANILDSAPYGTQGRLQNLRGATVEVTATLKPGRDAHFALMGRPSGRLVSLSPDAPDAPKAEIVG